MGGVAAWMGQTPPPLVPSPPRFGVHVGPWQRGRDPGAMDALKGQVLTTKETTLITVSKEDQNRGNAPSGYLSRASSNAGLTQLETEAFKTNGMIQAMLPDSQKILKNELEIIKSQLHAQAKAFEALSHSVSLLEQESSLQQRKIQQLEEELSRACGLAQGEMFEQLVDGKILDVWAAMAKEVEGLQESLLERPDHRMIQRGDSLENLSLEILESKKFLWEELESVQEDQEDDITKNLISIKKMHENQVKCRKILSQLKGKGPGAEVALESVGRGRDSRPVKEELNDIWSAVNTLQNSMASCSLWGDGQAVVRVTGRRSRRHRTSISASPPAPAAEPALCLYQEESSSCEGPCP
ncbi:LOW QUALITY PROTEIN: coiled-coil domain-containing protein 159 [Dermochelys coriacea]|uniref:LOW QUALITY PROTEIN: coiled-coil domain-containing protein 159 n=1 Tax=Dermochelys coriacea TaxID=27794 RepID=UPI001CA7BB3B|nr:LOW QUALITY PROTEIN: coiled-coil domain-containing protein 159 [Dermochelys coriacea]